MVHISAAIGQFFGAILKGLLFSAGAAVAMGVVAVVAVFGALFALRWLVRRGRQ
jgi:hypothetical protein